VKRVALALLLALIAAPPVAEARSQLTFGYRADQVFAASVRFLRVDEDATIVDKDADAGYVIFSYRSEGKTFRGALEVVATEKDGRAQVTVAITLTDRPDYLEATMLERLRRKLRAELGDEPPAPPPRPRPAPAKPAEPESPDARAR
jgi:hypothetical protein